MYIRLDALFVTLAAISKMDSPHAHLARECVEKLEKLCGDNPDGWKRKAVEVTLQAQLDEGAEKGRITAWNQMKMAHARNGKITIATPELGDALAEQLVAKEDLNRSRIRDWLLKYDEVMAEVNAVIAASTVSLDARRTASLAEIHELALRAMDLATEGGPRVSKILEKISDIAKAG